MRDVLCVYYSRSGNTKKVMKAIAAELDVLYLRWEELSEAAGEA